MQIGWDLPTTIPGHKTGGNTMYNVLNVDLIIPSLYDTEKQQ